MRARDFIGERNTGALRNFLITRFGIGQSRPGFFDARFDLFERLLIPSLLRQTDQSFEFLLATDIRAPQRVLTRIEKILSTLPAAKLVLHDPFDSLTMTPDVPSFLRAEGVADGDFVITTRLDADDALHKEFFQVLSRAGSDYLESAERRVPCAFESNKGVFYYPRTELSLKLEKRNYSIVSIGDFLGPEFLHCHSRAHTQINREFRENPGRISVQLGFEGNPIWLRTIHQHTATRAGRPVSFIETRFYFLKILRSIFWRVFGRGARVNNYIGKCSTAEIRDYFGIDVGGLRQIFRSKQVEDGGSGLIFMNTYMDSAENPFDAKHKILDFVANQEPVSTRTLLSARRDFYSF